MTSSIVAMPASEVMAGSLKKKRVLLVDKSAVKRDLRAETMRKLGMDVDTAADVIEARSWWRADLYDLVLFDVASELGHREDFCNHIRGATPPQQVAFLVGKPEYLANVPNDEAVTPIPPDESQDQMGEVKFALQAQLPGNQPQKWGILEASRRISVVRSLSHARTKAIRARPDPPRDSESRLSKRTKGSLTLDDLFKQEMP